MESDPNLTYANFWKTLKLDFGRDLTGVYRKEWDKVTLGGARNITPQMWRQFEADFELKARRVGDITDREKEDRIKLELPQDLRHRLGEENLRVSSTRHWVKIPEPLPVPVDRLEMFLARVLGKPVVHLERSGHAYLLDCGSRTAVDAVRTLDGWGGDGHILRVLSHSKGMTWKEMSVWVMGQLRLRDEEMAYDLNARHTTFAVQGSARPENSRVATTPVAPDLVSTPPTSTPPPTFVQPSYGPSPSSWGPPRHIP